MNERRKDGSRRIELTNPIDAGCKVVIDHLILKPVRLGHVLRWQNGKIKSAMALLAELSDQVEATLEQLCFSDADMVMGEFALHCPSQIRSTLGRAAAVDDPGEAPADSDDRLEIPVDDGGFDHSILDE